MTLTVTADLNNSVTVDERHGVKLAASSRYFVDSDAYFTSAAIHHAGVVAHADVPGLGDRWDNVTPYKGLIATRRTVQIHNAQQATVDVKYEYINETLNSINAVTTTANTVRSVVTDTTVDGTEINVTHQGLTEAAEVSVQIPDGGFSIRLQCSTDDPVADVHDAWLGKVNSSVWVVYGGAIASWLCTAVDWEPIDNDELWLFNFTFRWNPRTWSPEAKWILRDTGRAPAALDASGRKNVDWYDSRDFNTEPAARS